MWRYFLMTMDGVACAFIESFPDALRDLTGVGFSLYFAMVSFGSIASFNLSDFSGGTSNTSSSAWSPALIMISFSLDCPTMTCCLEIDPPFFL